MFQIQKKNTFLTDKESKSQLWSKVNTASLKALEAEDINNIVRSLNLFTVFIIQDDEEWFDLS